MTPYKSSDVKEKFNIYPPEMKEKLLELRELVFDVANSEKSITDVEETLKSGMNRVISPKTEVLLEWIVNSLNRINTHSISTVK